MKKAYELRLDDKVAEKADATLTPIYSDTPTFSEWTGTVVDAENIVVTGLPYYQPHDDKHEESYGWYLPTSHQNLHLGVYDKDAVSLSFNAQVDDWYLNYTATRTRTDIIGYTLGSQADKQIAAADPLLFAQYYPDGSVKSAAEFTPGIKYDTPDTANRTITVKPFCNTVDPENDNSGLVGRVVIPPFVDSDGNGYISDDGTRFKVIGVSADASYDVNLNLTAIVAPNTVTNIGDSAFRDCSMLSSISIPAATNIGVHTFADCDALTSVMLPAATTIDDSAFETCDSFTYVSLPAATSIEELAFAGCTSLAAVDFGDTPRPTVPTLGAHAFVDVPTTCRIIVPDAQYSVWVAASGWSTLYANGYKFLRRSEWEYARKYETVLTEHFTPWVVSGLPDGASNVSVTSKYDESIGKWVWTIFWVIGGTTPYHLDAATQTDDITVLRFSTSGNIITATRRAELQLGGQDDKPIQPAGSYLAKEDIVAPSVSAADSGKAADAKATGEALSRKADAAVLSGLSLAEDAKPSGVADVLREVLRRLGGQQP